MSFVWNLLALAAVVAAILVPIFIGHALASHSGPAIGIGVGALVLAAALVALAVRSGRRSRPKTRVEPGGD